MLLSLLVVAGCAQILDLEEPVLRSSLDGGLQLPDGSVQLPDGAVAQDDCEEYCSRVTSVCTLGFRVFETADNCRAVCRRYEPGVPSTLAGNTRACRLGLLRTAGRVGEATGICQAVGPGGSPATAGTSEACGSNCEGYCSLRARVCGADRAECMRQCSALPDKGSYDAPNDFGSGEDTLQCRLAHLTVAATYEEEGDDGNRRRHCEHSDIRSRNRQADMTLGDGTCDAVKPENLKCPDYCKMVMTTCRQSPPYESTPQCVAFCEKLTKGSTSLADSTGVDTLRCRREGAYEVLRQGENPVACMNAGPAPDRCGTGKCSAYCTLAKKACSTAFDQEFPGGDADCLTKCSALAGDELNAPYNATSEQARTGANLQCRVLRLTRALEAPMPSPALCAEVVGAAGACR